MDTTIQSVTFRKIFNVRKSGDEEGVYIADVELCPSEGFPFEIFVYVARADDYAPTGKWVYQQILDGNFEGDITYLPSGVDLVTGEPYPPLPPQPISQGSQTL